MKKKTADTSFNAPILFISVLVSFSAAILLWVFRVYTYFFIVVISIWELIVPIDDGNMMAAVSLTTIALGFYAVMSTIFVYYLGLFVYQGLMKSRKQIG